MLLLGSYHFANPGLDAVQMEADDVLSPQRQEEIAEVVQRLAAFQPTKVAFEQVTALDDQLNDEYAAYRRDEFELPRGEQYQIGFRLAKAMGHERVYPVDWNEKVGDVHLGHLYEYAQSHHPDIAARLQGSGEALTEGFQEAQKRSTVREMLLGINAPDSSARDHAIYLQLARIGEGTNYLGVEWVVNYWYRRNMIIYANIARITEPGDRVLVIYGSGHLHLLAQFLRESGSFQVESAFGYLR